MRSLFLFTAVISFAACSSVPPRPETPGARKTASKRSGESADCKGVRNFNAEANKVSLQVRFDKESDEYPVIVSVRGKETLSLRGRGDATDNGVRLELFDSAGAMVGGIYANADSDGRLLGDFHANPVVHGEMVGVVCTVNQE